MEGMTPAALMLLLAHLRKAPARAHDWSPPIAATIIGVNAAVPFRRSSRSYKRAA